MTASSENNQLKKKVFALGVLNVLFFIGMVTGIVLTIKANNDLSARADAPGFAANPVTVVDGETGEEHDCVKIVDIAKMYDAYEKGVTVTFQGDVVEQEDMDMKISISSPICDRILGADKDVELSDGSGRKLSDLSDEEIFDMTLKNVRVGGSRELYGYGRGYGGYGRGGGCRRCRDRKARELSDEEIVDMTVKNVRAGQRELGRGYGGYGRGYGSF